MIDWYDSMIFGKNSEDSATDPIGYKKGLENHGNNWGIIYPIS